MPYSHQSQTSADVLTGAEANQSEENIASHFHGADGVSGLFPDSDSTEVDVGTGTTSVYTFTIPAGKLAAGKALKCTILGRITSTNANRSIDLLDVSLGGSVVASLQSPLDSANLGGTSGLLIEITVLGLTANSQMVFAQCSVKTGSGTNLEAHGMIGLGSEDSTGTIAFEVEMSINNASNYDVLKEFAFIEYVEA